MKKIAVITGASSGMGKRFAQRVNEFGTFDEVWVIARHKEQLEALRERLGRDGRILLRKSGTEPVVRVMVEAASRPMCEALAGEMVNTIRAEGLSTEA